MASQQNTVVYTGNKFVNNLCTMLTNNKIVTRGETSPRNWRPRSKQNTSAAASLPYLEYPWSRERGVEGAMLDLPCLTGWQFHPSNLKRGSDCKSVRIWGQKKNFAKKIYSEIWASSVTKYFASRQKVWAIAKNLRQSLKKHRRLPFTKRLEFEGRKIELWCK